MRLISQNGNYDVPYEKVAVTTSFLFGNKIFVQEPGATGDWIPMAEYSSEEKVKKALRLLHEAYSGTVLIRNLELSEDAVEIFKMAHSNMIFTSVDNQEPKIEFLNNRIFRFPNDKDIEV